MYKHYNPNPVRTSAGDCVIRALCAALGASWYDVYTALSVQGYMMGDWGNSDSVWGAYLRAQSFDRHSLPNICPDCYTVGDFARDHSSGVYVLGTGSHAVAVIGGDVYDSFDSSGMIPVFFYERTTSR